MVFTGDLVHAAGLDLHDDAYDFLLDRVSKVTGCSDERIFIAAGNHDLSWSGLEKFADEMRAWRSMFGQPDEMTRLNELYEVAAVDTAVAAKFANYLELERYLDGGGRRSTRRMSNSFVTVYHLDALNIDMVIFNTSIFSTGGHRGFAKDERNLAVPEYAVIEAVKCLTPGSLRIFVTHHPFAMLSEPSARYLENEITKHANIHLFGHMHDPQPKKIVGLTGEVLSDQAGALFVSRKTYYSGYALITYDRSNGNSETLVRSYFKERNEFDEGIDVIEEGRWWSSNQARSHFRRIAVPVDDIAFRAHLAGLALDGLKAREDAVGGEGDLHFRFVPPPMRLTFIQDVTGEGKSEIETSVSIDDMVISDTNFIVYAKPEYGRTTLLKEMRYRLLANASKVRFPRLPVFLDFADITSNAENLLRKARAGAEATPPQNDVESLLKLGHACVLVDDVNFSDVARMRVLRAFVERFPKARYALSSPQSSATKVGAFVDPQMPVRFEFVEIREFRRNDMRQLLAKEERCTDVEGWLDRLQNEFREINLPFTAANGTILIEILSEKYNFTPINRAVLMEQFVDSTLRKAAIEQSRRAIFDYTNKTDLLSYIASWMARNNDYVPLKESVRGEMKSYIDSKGLNAPLDSLLTEFLSARIFIDKTENRVSFRYRGVMEYFIALRMTTDVDFKDWILEESRYLIFINEILYYAGKLRNDAALLDLVAQRHSRIMTELAVEGGDGDLGQLDTIQLPLDKQNESVDTVAREFASPPLSQEERDAELEGNLPEDAEDRQEVSRPTVEEASDRVIFSLLLYSGLVKNMELVSDAQKRIHLSAIWKAWGLVLVTALRFAPRLARERRVRINGALYEVQAPQGMTDTVLLRNLMLRLPHVHIRMISGALGTEKLERQLTEATTEERGEAKIIDLMRVGLIADLRLASTPEAVKLLALKLRGNTYLLWSLIVHVSELRRLNRVKEEHFRKLEEPLAGAIANLKGGSRKQRDEEKRRQINRLAKDRLVLTIEREQDP